MLFHQLHSYLTDRVSFSPEHLELPEIGQALSNYTFFSESHGILANAAKIISPIHLEDLSPEDIKAGELMNAVTLVPDHEIEENKEFRHHVLSPLGAGDAQGVIILLHGFNERNWSKYLPWAAELVAKTQKTVILFPIAFHMNRSPALWTDSRDMRAVSQLRKKLLPNDISSTLSNAAISVRLSVNPSRFFWSGLESFMDINLLVKRIKEGRQPGIQKGAKVDLFTYSIGTLLAEIVFMTNEESLFSDSKLVAFCGGPTFNRLSPVSKFILDSEANVLLYSYLVEHLDSHIKNDPQLALYLENSARPVGRNFKTMLNYKVDLEYREDKFRQLSNKILAITLKKDEVVHPYEVVGTLNGSKRDIPIRIIDMDPPYPYRHEDPFPITLKIGEKVTETFHELFAPICEFLR
ncbi:MAG: DUF6051 family protein [Deltaproteobacteria bacterium]|jgi:hypothetical protein|nr:DUF6051 family protein [Deltaproteobacteria bacterium]